MKRAFAGALWFVAVWCMTDLVCYATGLPRLLGPAVGALLAAGVVLDPLVLFWERPTRQVVDATSSTESLRAGLDPTA